MKQGFKDQCELIKQKASELQAHGRALSDILTSTLTWDDKTLEVSEKALREVEDANHRMAKALKSLEVAQVKYPELSEHLDSVKFPEIKS